MKKRQPSGGGGAADDESRNAAAALAIAALSFIGRDPQRLDRFVALSGIDPESIRAAARELHFLLGVLDHILADEPLLLAFAGQSGVDPGDVMRAREAIAGTEAPDDSP